MHVAVFNTKTYDQLSFEQANQDFNHDLSFIKAHLTPETLTLAQGFHAICAFVNDELTPSMLKTLSEQGLKLIALRSAGFNNVNLAAANKHQITVVRVPAYSPYAVAEHAIGLLLALNRKIHRAYLRVREGNFSLEGLMGFDLHGKTVGIIGTGRIGSVMARILKGFDCHVIACDPKPSSNCQSMGVQYTPLETILTQSDIITLHCPLTPDTHHIIDTDAFAKMKPEVILINTSRGAIIDTKAAIQAIKSGKIGGLALDVYEEEGDLFFEDLSEKVIQDDVFMRLLTFPNVIITGHQAYFTQEAIANIAHTTLANISEFEKTGKCQNEVSFRDISK